MSDKKGGGFDISSISDFDFGDDVKKLDAIIAEIEAAAVELFITEEFAYGRIGETKRLLSPAEIKSTGKKWAANRRKEAKE